MKLTLEDDTTQEAKSEQAEKAVENSNQDTEPGVLTFDKNNLITEHCNSRRCTGSFHDKSNEEVEGSVDDNY